MRPTLQTVWANRRRPDSAGAARRVVPIGVALRDLSVFVVDHVLGRSPTSFARPASTACSLVSNAGRFARSSPSIEFVQAPPEWTVCTNPSAISDSSPQLLSAARVLRVVRAGCRQAGDPHRTPSAARHLSKHAAARVLVSSVADRYTLP
jgi:hypothetical protein